MCIKLESCLIAIETEKGLKCFNEPAKKFFDINFTVYFTNAELNKGLIEAKKYTNHSLLVVSYAYNNYEVQK